MRAQGIEPGVPLARWLPEEPHGLLVAVTEVNRPEDLKAYADGAAAVLSSPEEVQP